VVVAFRPWIASEMPRLPICCYCCRVDFPVDSHPGLWRTMHHFSGSSLLCVVLALSPERIEGMVLLVSWKVESTLNDEMQSSFVSWENWRTQTEDERQHSANKASHADFCVRVWAVPSKKLVEPNDESK
jgi:hypothetical protein